MKIAISSSELLLEVRCIKAPLEALGVLGGGGTHWEFFVLLLPVPSQQGDPVTALFLKGSFPQKAAKFLFLKNAGNSKIQFPSASVLQQLSKITLRVISGQTPVANVCWLVVTVRSSWRGWGLFSVPCFYEKNDFLKLFWRPFSVSGSLLCGRAGYPGLPVIYNYDGFVQVILHQSIHPCPPVVIILFDATELQRSGGKCFQHLW